MSSGYLFTSESVSEGHPDKVADQISDAVLDAILMQDKRGRVACETLVKTGVVIVAGEVTTSAWVDIEALVRKNYSFQEPNAYFSVVDIWDSYCIFKFQPNRKKHFEC